MTEGGAIHLIHEQKSAEGKVALVFFRAKARTVLRQEVNWSGR